MELVKTIAQSVAVSALCLYLFIEHTVIVALLPVLIVIACLYYPVNQAPTRQLMDVAIVTALAISLVLPASYNLVGPVTSYAFLILTTNIDTIGFTACLAIWATSVTAFVGDYDAVAIASMVTSLLSICGFIVTNTKKGIPFGILAACGFFPVIASVFYDHLASETDPAPTSVVVLTGISIGLSLL